MKVIVDDLAIEYEDHGSGKTLLFLHGWQDSLETFDKVTDTLFLTHRVVRLDLPGFGKSEMPPSAWDLDHYVNLVEHFIVKLNLKVAGIIGHSFGGRIAIKGVARQIFKPEGLVLIGSAGLARRNSFRNIFFKSLAKIGKIVTLIPPLYFFRDQIRARLYRHVARDYINAGNLREIFLKIIAEDLALAAGLIKIPTLLIWGKHDTETPLRDGTRFSKLIKNSELKVIPRAGHFVHREEPAKVAELIHKFYE